MAERPTRRLFFALWPDETTRAALVRATRKAVKRSGGRPVPATNLHLTLAFLGNQPAASFDDIVAGASAVRAPRISLALDRFGHWPKPRVLWIGPTECPGALTELSVALWDRMATLGIERERKPFRAHVTLARKVAALPELPTPSPLIWNASSFTLIESVTEQSGAVYTVAHEYPLIR
jgi:2'-5' RNA ligase